MLIKALCDYYDVLASQGKVLPDGYSNVNIHYLVCLTPEGEIDEIIDWQKTEKVPAGKDKFKEKTVPRNVVMPKRTEKPGIDSNIIEHRPLYIFGLNYDDGTLTTTDKTNKARKSHEAFVKANLAFIDGLDSPVINAYRAFMESWEPKNETENPHLLELQKKYVGAGYAFCLSGRIDLLLHEDDLIKQKWNNYVESLKSNSENSIFAQCAISGKEDSIARIHDKIKGVYGGLSTGTGLICFNNDSENSYGNDQSYNSNVSEQAMKKYTEALNCLLMNKKSRAILDEMTIVFWANNDNEKCSELMSALIFGEKEAMDASQTQDMLNSIFKDAKEGNITSERIASIEGIDPNVDFYMVGLKPNSSRLSLKFIYRKRFGELLVNVAKHQRDMQISEEIQPTPLWRIKKEMVFSNSKNETADPALVSKIFESIIYGTPYPEFLLSTMVRRAKIDKNTKKDKEKDIKNNPVRAGVIKACINRKSRFSHQKEELKLALDKENKTPAYLCGRLFAVLEKAQEEAAWPSKLNRTIKDSYFASASSKPAITFPKLLDLLQHHIKKTRRPLFFKKLVGEIIDKLCREFPNSLSLTDQGIFIIGYYQQYQNFFETNEIEENNNLQEEE